MSVADREPWISRRHPSRLNFLLSQVIRVWYAIKSGLMLTS